MISVFCKLSVDRWFPLDDFLELFFEDIVALAVIYCRIWWVIEVCS